MPTGAGSRAPQMRPKYKLRDPTMSCARPANSLMGHSTELTE